MIIFRRFSLLLDAINEVAVAIRSLASAQRDIGPASHRLEALELHRAQFEAEMQGLLLKADGKLKAANNSEARERVMKNAYDRENTDLFREEGAERSQAGPILPDHVETGEAERLPALHLDVALSPKASAVNAKWLQFRPSFAAVPRAAGALPRGQ